MLPCTVCLIWGQMLFWVSFFFLFPPYIMHFGDSKTSLLLGCVS